MSEELKLKVVETLPKDTGGGYHQTVRCHIDSTICPMTGIGKLKFITE